MSYRTRERLKTAAFVVLAIAVVLIGVNFFAVTMSDCKKAGGEMVKTINGTYKCMKTVEVEVP